MKYISFLCCCVILSGCLGNRETKALNDESVEVVNTNVNSNNEVSYTNVYVGSEEDINSGPCCANSPYEEEEDISSIGDSDFIFPEEEEEVDTFTFRGEGDCVGRCKEDIRACYAKFKQEIKENWHNPGADVDSCRLYSCGSFGMAYFKRGTMLYWHGDASGDDESNKVRDVDWGKEGEYWYKRQIPESYNNYEGRVLVSYPGGHLCHRASQNNPWSYTDDPCIEMVFPYDGREYFGGAPLFSRTDGINSEVGDTRTLFSEVFSCDNVVDWVLPTSRYINDNYNGCELDEWGNMNCSKDDLERGYDQCIDGIDNDGDGLIDCDDLNCSNDILNKACN